MLLIDEEHMKRVAKHKYEKLGYNNKTSNKLVWLLLEIALAEKGLLKW